MALENGDFVDECSKLTFPVDDFPLQRVILLSDELVLVIGTPSLDVLGSRGQEPSFPVPIVRVP